MRVQIPMCVTLEKQRVVVLVYTAILVVQSYEMKKDAEYRLCYYSRLQVCFTIGALAVTKGKGVAKRVHLKFNTSHPYCRLGALSVDERTELVL